TLPTDIDEGSPVRLSYYYLPGTLSSRLTIRLSGSGVVSSADNPPEGPAWVYATATGTATATPNLYIYLDRPGTINVDNVKLVVGTVAEAGPNLLVGADFEGSSLTNNWLVTGNHSNSTIGSTVAFTGARSLNLVSAGVGGSTANSVYQVVPGLANGQT